MTNIAWSIEEDVCRVLPGCMPLLDATVNTDYI